MRVWWGCQEYMPVAQTLVLRRVLTGGISTNSGRRFFPGTQYGHPPLWGGGPGTVPGRVTGGLVFGTLLGPEATGPWRHWLGVPLRGSVPVVAVWDLCFWFPGCTERARLCVWGVWYGVVV